MTLSQNRQLQTGLAGSVVIHAGLLLLLVLGFSLNGGGWRPHLRAKPKPVEKEMVLLLPAQLVPPPPQPKVPAKTFIRTSQNEAAPKAAARTMFESDRNTTAASEKAAVPDATLAMPTMSGQDRIKNELANRDSRDGELQNDDPAPKALAVPQMLAGEAPDPLLKPKPTPPAPAPTPPPTQVAKAETGDSPLSKMIAEMDREAVRLEVNRLPLEIRKPGDPPPADSPPAKPAPTPPPAPKAKTPIPDPIAARKKPATEGFSPHTRTSSIKGTISNRGKNAVDAESTARGIYTNAVVRAMEKKWHTYYRLTGDAANYGNLTVQFFVTLEGKIEDLRITSDPKDADTRMTDFTLRAIKDAEIPPIPPEVLSTLDEGRMPIEYEFIIYR